MKKLSNEIRLLLLIGFAAVLALPLYRAMKKSANSRYYLVINDAGGISPENSPIFIKGLEVGRTEAAELFRNNVLVTLSIRKNIRLPRPAVPRPGSNALGLATTSINIEPDSNATACYQPGDTLYNLEFVKKDTTALRQLDSLRTKLLLQAVRSLIRVKPAKTGDSAN